MEKTLYTYFPVLSRLVKTIPFLILVTLMVGCSGNASNPPTPEPALSETSQPEATQPPTIEPTAEPVKPLDKLLNPCAYVPASEVEALYGSQIHEVQRRSIMVPTMRKTVYGEHEPVMERVLYECTYVSISPPDWEHYVGLSVEVFPSQDDALAQLETFRTYYDNYLALEEIQPMVELDRLGDRAYSFVAQPVRTRALTLKGVPIRNIPIIYFASGEYLVHMYFSWALTIEENQAHFEKVLELAGNLLADLPQDSSSPMADQDYSLADPWLPPNLPVEACELISRDEAQALMEEPISIEDSGSYFLFFPDYWGASCEYGSFQKVGISIGSDTDNQVERFINDLRNEGLPEVSGVGDFAFRGNAGNTDSDLTVFVGNSIVSIVIINYRSEEEQFQAALDLYELALSRLPENILDNN